MLFKRKKREVLSLQIFERKCIGCESCVDICRHKALGMIYTLEKSYASVEFIGRCVGCGRCMRECPVDAIELIVKQ